MISDGEKSVPKDLTARTAWLAADDVRRPAEAAVLGEVQERSRAV
jgi:hypothetical protein